MKTEKENYMDREDMEWLQSIQAQAYRLYAINKMPEDDYRLLDDTIDTILHNNGVNIMAYDTDI